MLTYAKLSSARTISLLVGFGAHDRPAVDIILASYVAVDLFDDPSAVPTFHASSAMHMSHLLTQ